MNKWFGGFSDVEDMKKEFEEKGEDFPTEEEILFASYEGGSYEGDAFVLFERDGKLFENHGSHCSCYGLEGQWGPEETSWEALAIRPKSGLLSTYDYDKETRDALWALIGSHVPEFLNKEESR